MNKTSRSILIGFAVIVLLVSVFGSGVAAGRLLPLFNPSLANTLPASASGGDQAGTPKDLKTLFAPFWEAWNIVHQQYVDQPVDDTKMMEGAIRGMMESLGDQHSSYMNPQEYTDATTAMQGTYAGIGAYVDTEGEWLTIVRPMPASPAENAGLQNGDKVIAVDGNDMTGIDPTLVRLKVLGPAGTTVKLTIQRADQDQPLEISITRANIVVPSVESRMLDNNIAYIKITIFGDSTTQDFKDQLGALMAQNPKGLIIDLRDNGGGYLDTAISVASQIVPDGVIVYEQSGDGSRKTYNAESGGLATEIPVVVLVNGYSASASEIVAGAIQDTGRGKLVGEKTYGKGSVQNWIPLENDEGAVRVTIAKWLTPNGRSIHKQGLAPDVSVLMTAEDYKAKRDPQLDAAIHVFVPEETVDTGNAPPDQGNTPSEQDSALPADQGTATGTPMVTHVWSMNDTYAGLAFQYYGSMQEPYWRLIYEHNQVIIGGSPNDIRVGLEIEIPPLPDNLKK